MQRRQLPPQQQQIATPAPQPLQSSSSQISRPTPMEQMQNNAIFLAQNIKTKLFNIQSYTTNLLEQRLNEKTTLLQSKDILREQEYGQSPLFFKISGSVAYCPQLGGCCIFYNRGINNENIRILYSLQCQQEIFDEALKLYENTIPNYRYLFQMCFSRKLYDKFKLLGLSEDTILLKIKNEAPSQRNKFVYNVALLQLQMLRFDFIISPNLTQYYVKQYLNNEYPIGLLDQQKQQSQYNTSCNIINQQEQICTSEVITTSPLPQPPSSSGQPVCSMLKVSAEKSKEYIINANDFSTTKKQKKTTRKNLPADFTDDDYNDDDNEDAEDSDNSSGDESLSILEDYDEETMRPPPPLVLHNISMSEERDILPLSETLAGLEKEKKLLDIDDLGKSGFSSQVLKRKLPQSITSSETTTSLRDNIGVRASKSIASQDSSVDIMLPRNSRGPLNQSQRSETGLTEKFANITCQSNAGAVGISTSSSSSASLSGPSMLMTAQNKAMSMTGVTDPFCNLNLEDDFTFDDEYTFTQNIIQLPEEENNVTNNNISKNSSNIVTDNIITEMMNTALLNSESINLNSENCNLIKEQSGNRYNPLFINVLDNFDKNYLIELYNVAFSDINDDVKKIVGICDRSDNKILQNAKNAFNNNNENRLYQAIYLYVLICFK